MGKVPPNLLKHVLTVNVVEAIFKVDLEAPLLLGLEDFTVEGSSGCVDDCLAASPHPHTKLQGA